MNSLKSKRRVLAGQFGVIGLIASGTGKKVNCLEYGTVRDGCLNTQGIGYIETRYLTNEQIAHLSTYDGDIGRIIE